MVQHIVKLSVFLIPFIVIYILTDINYSDFPNLDNILMASIAFSSSSLGFFIAGVSLLQTSHVSKFYKNLVQLGTNKKIIAWLMSTIAYMFSLSAISLISMFLDPETYGFILDIWVSLICASLISTLFIVVNFYIVFTGEK